MLILKKFLRDVPAVLGFCIILMVCLTAILSPLIVPNLDMVYDGDLISRLIKAGVVPIVSTVPELLSFGPGVQAAVNAMNQVTIVDPTALRELRRFPARCSCATPLPRRTSGRSTPLQMLRRRANKHYSAA